MTGRRELWEVARFSGPRRGFQPQCDCYRTDDPPALHLVLELPGVDPAAVRIVAVGTTLVVSGVRERPHPTAARYHQPADEWSADWDLSGMAQDLSMLYAVGSRLANSRAWPNWSADSEFRAERDRTAAQRR